MFKEYSFKGLTVRTFLNQDGFSPVWASERVSGKTWDVYIDGAYAASVETWEEIMKTAKSKGFVL